jgi:hypothetical protein
MLNESRASGQLRVYQTVGFLQRPSCCGSCPCASGTPMPHHRRPAICPRRRVNARGNYPVTTMQRRDNQTRVRRCTAIYNAYRTTAMTMRQPIAIVPISKIMAVSTYFFISGGTACCWRSIGGSCGSILLSSYGRRRIASSWSFWSRRRRSRFRRR